MKLYSIAVFVSTLLVLHTATANPGVGLRYIRSSLDNVSSRYRIRDTRPDFDSVSATPSQTDTDNADVIPQAADKANLLQQEGSVRPGKVAPEVTNDVAPDNEPTDEETIPPTAQTTLPTDVDYPAKRRGDGSGLTDPEFSEDADQDPQQNSVSESAFKKLKMYAGLNSVLANIARIPQAVALQIDSVIAGLQSTYPTNTNVGAYIMGTRFFLRNPRALKPFDLIDQAGFGRLPDLVSSMPSVFVPMINAADRVWQAIVRRISAMVQRLAGAVRSISSGASRSLAGINFARGMDSYSISVPNLIDMVLKGRLADRVDALFAFFQRLLGSGLSSVGSVFNGSNPTSEPVSAISEPPVKNQATYRQRSPPRFSALRDHYRPSRYFNNN